ncbi:glycosyltransferase family 2 protein [Maricaulis sp. CAU 1757]
MPRLSVVTVSWKTGPRLLEAVASILNAPGVDEFVLVNHGNPPEMNQALQEYADGHDCFTLINTGRNLGFAKGCNLGAEAATGDLVLFLNPDAVLSPGVTRRLKQSAVDLGPEPWAIGARILNADGTEQRGGRRGELTPNSALVAFLGLDRLIPGTQSLHLERQPLEPDIMPVPVVSGAALMMRRSSFLDLGGFDERYFLHVEDIDLCRRVREAGGSVWFEPRANILHYGGTSQSSPFFVETQKAKGFVKYFWRFYPGLLERLTTLCLVVPIFGAIWGRVLLLRLKGQWKGLRRRQRAMGRLKRIRNLRLDHPRNDVAEYEAPTPGIEA